MQGQQKTILVVDDSEANRELLNAILTEHAFKVILAEDATQAIALARRDIPELAILDFEMPAGTGSSVYSVLRKLTELPEIPIIFVSGTVTSHNQELSKILDSDPKTRFIPKPYDPDDLCSLVKHFLSDKYQAEETSSN